MGPLTELQDRLRATDRRIAEVLPLTQEAGSRPSLSVILRSMEKQKASIEATIREASAKR